MSGEEVGDNNDEDFDPEISTESSSDMEDMEEDEVESDPSDKKKSSFFFFFLFVLDVPHLTNEHRTQDCIAS